MNIIFNPEKHFLGQLCRHGHEWENTGKSLRVRTKYKTHRCAVCVYLHNHRHLGDKEHSKKRYADYGKNWHENNKERLSEERKIYRQKNSQRIKERGARYRENNRQALLEANKDYYRRNRTKVLVRCKKYRLDNKEACSQRAKLYRLKNIEAIRERRRLYLSTPRGKELVRLYKNRRRVKAANCHAAPYQVKDVFERFDNKCAYCGATGKLDIDHFIAISRGGADCLNNVVTACDFCNSSKNNRDPIEWYKSQPFYSKKRLREILIALGKNESNYNQIPLF